MLKLGDWVRYRSGVTTYRVIEIKEDYALVKALFASTTPIKDETMSLHPKYLKLVNKKSIYSAFKKKLSNLEEVMKIIEENM